MVRAVCSRAATGALGVVFPETGLAHVLVDHALGIEERAVERDRVAHYVDVTVLVVLEHWQHDGFEFVVQRFGVEALLVDVSASMFTGAVAAVASTASGAAVRLAQGDSRQRRDLPSLALDTARRLRAAARCRDTGDGGDLSALFGLEMEGTQPEPKAKAGVKGPLRSSPKKKLTEPGRLPAKTSAAKLLVYAALPKAPKTKGRTTDAGKRKPRSKP